MPRRRSILLGTAFPAVLGAVLGAAPALADPAMPVALRPLVVVDDPALRLGDLFEGVAGPRASTIVGAAPAPGRRMQLETAQLAALARNHGLTWRPLTPHERTVVERPGRPIPREEIEATLKADLVRLGVDPTSELDLGPLLPPMVPPSALLHLATEGLSFDPAQGRFAVTLVVSAEGMPTLRQRLSGRAVPTVPVVLATRRLALGEVVRPGDVQLARLRVERARPGTAEEPARVVGQQLRRPVAAGQPFALADLGAPLVVEKNMLVTMVVEGPGMLLTAQGRAMAAAPRGATVAVMNLTSQTVVEGEVIGPARVRVTNGGARVPAPAPGAVAVRR